MCALRTILVGLALCLGTVSPAVASGTLVRDFAMCAGRLSAEMEFRWLMRRPADGVTRDRSAALDVLDALGSPDTRTRVLAWRIEAKQAQSALLHRGAFGTDAEDAQWATARAAEHLAACRAYLLPNSDAEPGV